MEIYLDSDTGITFQQCQKMSRHIEANLDEEQWFGQKYAPEVSSQALVSRLLHRQYVAKCWSRLRGVKMDKSL